MRDAMAMVFVLWFMYWVGLLFHPETMQPLSWEVGVASIFITLLGMFVELALSAQEFRLKEQEHKQTMERKAFDHQAELDYRSQANQFHGENASYFIDGLGRTRNK